MPFSRAVPNQAASASQLNQILDSLTGVPGSNTINLGMTTLGDLITGGASGNVQRLAIGNNNQVLTVVGGIPAWSNSPAGFANPMTTLGDLITGGAAGAAGRLNIGGANQILTVVGGVPAWANAAAGFANPMTNVGDIIVGGAAGAGTRLAIGAANTVLTSVAGTPAWQAPAAAPLTYVTNALAADVVMGVANTFFNGPSIALTAGTWLITGTVTVAGGAGSRITAKIWDGITVAGSSEITIANNILSIALSCVVVLAGNATWKISVADITSNSTISSAAADNGAGNNASRISAVKIA